MKAAGRRPKPLHDEFIQLGADAKKAKPEGADWGFMLLVFMRVVAAVWVFRGLLQWNTILSSEQTPFETLPVIVATCVIFFAVADLIAAVGLWLAAPWGGVLWLFSALAGILVAIAVPAYDGGGRVMMVVNFVLIVAYFVLGWYASRERID
jgi:hypothetical protein